MSDLFQQGQDQIRPPNFTMPIQGGMLEALGINMYTKLGKSLVEFIANAYDAEASEVSITIPHARINEERRNLRAAAKALAQDGQGSIFDTIPDQLPESLEVVIKDNGHGMGWQDIKNKFLPLNRKRRRDDQGKERQTKSETGKRFVMGRKGLGKLAGFGTASKVKVWSKRRGEDYATQIILDDDLLKNTDNLPEVAIPATYETGLDPECYGTVIHLAGLKFDAVQEQLDTLKRIINEAFFALKPEEFEIRINGEPLVPPPPDYELIYPEDASPDDLAEGQLKVDNVGTLDFKYFVGFRERGKHLKAAQRGARIYCNNRLAAGPSLLGLGTGMHSFHSQDYMECIVEADELDRSGVDFINTNRTQLREDNEVIHALIDKVTELMTEGIKAHAKYREGVAEKEMLADPQGQVLDRIVKELPKKTQQPARKLLNHLVAEYGAESEQFSELAPVVINSVNATEVLIKLIDLGTQPGDLRRIVDNLRELAEIERADSLKLYRGRRNGIQALLNLEQTGLELWNKRGIEDELHQLLKENPWLIRPEFSTCLASDQNLVTVVSKLAESLAVDDFGDKAREGSSDTTRPDLVFLISDPDIQGPHRIVIVELKSPSLALTIDHFRQLEDYIGKTNTWCGEHLSHGVNVQGLLIGAMPHANETAYPKKALLQRFQEIRPTDQIKIVPIDQLSRDAMAVHVEAIKALEAQELKEAEANTID